MHGRQLRSIHHEGLPALLAIPEGLTCAPLLCFLHGRDEAAPADPLDALTRFGPLSPGAPAEWVNRFLVVAPQLPRAGDLWHEQAQAVRSLVLRLQAEYGTDPARRYLTGFSYGGNGVFDLALEQPGFWAALWAVDPTRHPRRPLAEPVWLSIGPCVRLHEQAFIASLQSQPAGNDRLASRIHLDEGDDHTGCAERAYADARIYGWLLAHGR